MSSRDTSREAALLQLIVGEQLSSVQVGRNYVRLKFDGPRLTAITLPEVEINGRRFRRDQPGYLNALCAPITRKVAHADVLTGEAVKLTFDEGAVISVSLRPEDYEAAEALMFVVDESRSWML